jgi:hypothetical protein
MDLTLTPNTEVSTAPGVTTFDFNVMHGQLRVGRIRREAALKPESRWIWVVSVYDGPDVMRRSGMAATIEEAQAALEDSWQQWLAWAGLSVQAPKTDESSVHSDKNNQDEELLAAVLREAQLAARG